MNYTESLQYLHSLEKFGIKLGLEKIFFLLEALDHPEKSFPVVIVAGTNGKGSVSVMLSAILEDRGYRVGTYLSPHLISPEERIRVDGREISPDMLSRGIARIKQASDALISEKGPDSHATFFEILTALALHHFRNEKVDIAVMEAGLGGRFDATNAAPAILSIITNVSLDHQEYLGKKISLIAREKGGIIKPKGAVVSGARSSLVNTILADMCVQKKAQFYSVRDRVRTYINGTGNRVLGDFRTGDLALKRIAPAMEGRHQIENAATAFLSAVVLRGLGFDVPLKAMRSGLERARLSGRLETLRRKPSLIIDGAHNKSAALKVADYIRRLSAEKKYLVFGAMKDKDVGGMIKALFPLCEQVFLVPIASQKKRAMPPEEIRRQGLQYNPRIETFPALKKCFSCLSGLAGEKDAVICTGSIFLAGEIKGFFSAQQGAGHEC